MLPDINAWLIGAASGTAFVVVILVVLWRIGIIGKKSGEIVHVARSGDLPVERWDKKFADLDKRIVEVHQQLHDFLLLRNRDIADIKEIGNKIVAEVSDLTLEMAQLTREIRREIETHG